MIKDTWKIPNYTEECCDALVSADYTPLLAAVLRARGIDTAEGAAQFLSHGEDMLCDPLLLCDMDRAVARIERAVRDCERVAVYGDYDVDGITSTCLMTEYFRRNGIACLSYIPDRLDEGYGINAGAIESLREKCVTLVVTVDCGITAAEEVAFARSLGIDVVITDHHECPQTLPDAAAVVDPKRPGSRYPNEELAGVGVAFKLVCALENDPRGSLARYADLVAVGTIADVMPLTGENRCLVYEGLEKLKNAPRPGFEALLEESGAAKKPLNAATVGFTLAPRINAAGRLCKTGVSLRLLATADPEEARLLARELCDLNHRRQELELQVLEDALACLGSAKQDLPIVLESENWHPGVVGIAASRLTEEYHVPAIMICIEGGSGKGSCRSYGDFNLFEALSACADCLESFGGHAFAAGLSIRPERVDEFRARLADYYRAHLPESAPSVTPELLIGNPSVLTLEGVASLDELEPCGNGCEKPLMCMLNAILESVTPIGGGRHLRMSVEKNGARFDCVFFSHTLADLCVRPGMPVDLCFVPQVNDFRGHRSVQFLICAVRPSETLDTCRCILEMEEFSVEELRIFRPGRDELARAWRRIKQFGGRIEFRYEELSGGRRDFMDPVKFCLCIEILKELKLVDLKARDGCICCAAADDGRKTELTNSRLFTRLWGGSLTKH